MKQSVVYEVSDILDMFNLEEIARLLNQQINIDGVSELSDSPVDHFKPLYYKYKKILDSEGNSDEIRRTAEIKFTNICNIFLAMICRKYNLSIDLEWKDDHSQDLPGFTMALYSFFVLDLKSNIYNVCFNFINRNKNDIYSTFEDRKNKKDAMTLVNKKILTPEMAVIVSNIYDVTTWIMNQLTEEQFVLYLDQDYLPLKLIKGLLEDGIMSGDFMEELNNIYCTNFSVKSDVCFNLISNMKLESIA